jgi:hypothetical protein
MNQTLSAIDILVIMDYFSRRSEAVALKDKKTLKLAKCLIETVLTCTSSLSESDCFRPWVPLKLFKYFCDKFKIKHNLTTTYHPASNRETGRLNRDLKTMFKKEFQDCARKNSEGLTETLLFAYRNFDHFSTKATPLSFLHERDMLIFLLTNFLVLSQNHIFLLRTMRQSDK